MKCILARTGRYKNDYPEKFDRAAHPLDEPEVRCIRPGCGKTIWVFDDPTTITHLECRHPALAIGEFVAGLVKFLRRFALGRRLVAKFEQPAGAGGTGTGCQSCNARRRQWNARFVVPCPWRLYRIVAAAGNTRAGLWLRASLIGRLTLAACQWLAPPPIPKPAPRSVEKAHEALSEDQRALADVVVRLATAAGMSPREARTACMHATATMKGRGRVVYNITQPAQ